MIPTCKESFVAVADGRLRNCNLDEGHDGPHQVVVGWKHPEVLATGPTPLRIAPSEESGE
jgi:hypothetical protein